MMHPAWFDHFADWLGAEDKERRRLAVLWTVIWPTTTSVLLSFVDSPRWLIAAAVFGAVAAFVLRAMFHSLDRRYPMVSDVTRCPDGRWLA